MNNNDIIIGYIDCFHRGTSVTLTNDKKEYMMKYMEETDYDIMEEVKYMLEVL
jgi:hypothetical protein